MQKRIHRELIADPRGFTLIEILITLLIAGVVMAAIFSIFVSSNQSYRTQDSVADAQQRVRVGIDFMVDDLRMAGLDPTDSGNFGFETATGTKLRFTADVDLDGVVDNTNLERVTYEYDAANQRLRRCLYEGTGSESWQTLINDVSAVTFTYLDSSGAVAGTPADARSVLITLTAQGTNGQGGTFTRTLTTRVICRNLYL
jgi:type IV pilus assembly protein PilW